MTKTPQKLHETARKKKISPCTIKKRNLIVAAYRRNKGSIIDISRSTKISIRRVYQIFDDFPDVRQEIDTIDVAEVEELKQLAVKKLRENVKDKHQGAIEFVLEKEPRKERGKIVVNKDESNVPNIELWLGVRQEVIIE